MRKLFGMVSFLNTTNTILSTFIKEVPTVSKIATAVMNLSPFQLYGGLLLTTMGWQWLNSYTPLFIPFRFNKREFTAYRYIDHSRIEFKDERNNKITIDLERDTFYRVGHSVIYKGTSGSCSGVQVGMSIVIPFPQFDRIKERRLCPNYIEGAWSNIKNIEGQLCYCGDTFLMLDTEASAEFRFQNPYFKKAKEPLRPISSSPNARSVRYHGCSYTHYTIQDSHLLLTSPAAADPIAINLEKDLFFPSKDTVYCYSPRSLNIYALPKRFIVKLRIKLHAPLKLSSSMPIKDQAYYAVCRYLYEQNKPFILDLQDINTKTQALKDRLIKAAENRCQLLFSQDQGPIQDIKCIRRKDYLFSGAATESLRAVLVTAIGEPLSDTASTVGPSFILWDFAPGKAVSLSYHRDGQTNIFIGVIERSGLKRNERANMLAPSPPSLTPFDFKIFSNKTSLHLQNPHKLKEALYANPMDGQFLIFDDEHWLHMVSGSESPENTTSKLRKISYI